MLWPLSVVLVANTNGRLAIPALAGLLVTILVETTHAGKIMNPVHFEIDPADNRIRVNPDIRIRIPDQILALPEFALSVHYCV